MGKGDALDECNTIGSSAACASEVGAGEVCGRPVPLIQRCHRPHCPTCWRSWVQRAARRMTHQLLLADVALYCHVNLRAGPWGWAEEVLENDDGRPVMLRYVDGQVSFEQDQGDEWVGVDRYKDATSEACQVAQDAGVQGGYRVPHAYRLTDQAKDKLRSAGYGRHGENGSLWDGVHDDPYDVGWDTYVKPGLHTHFIGWSGQRGTPDALLNGSDAGLLERFSKDHRDQGDPTSVVDLFRACRYPLHHASPPEDAPRVSVPFGDAHGAASDRPETLLEELDEGVKGPSSLVEQANDAVAHVLDKLLNVPGEDGCMQCPECGDRDWVSIWQTRDLVEAHDDGHIEIRHRDALDVARALKHYGPDSTIPVAKACERGVLEREPDGSLPEIDPTDPADVHRLMGLDPPDDDEPDPGVSIGAQPEPPPDSDSDRSIPDELDRLFNPGDHRT